MTDSAPPPDWLASFLTADTYSRAQLIQQPAVLDAVRSALGEPFAREYAELAGTGLAQADHLGGRVGVNVLVIPGVMGSLLASETYAGIWWYTLANRRRLRDLGLTPDGLTDAFPDAAIRPVSVQPAYDSLVVALAEADDLLPRHFPYDWRKPLAASASLLDERIRAAHAGNGGDPVHLVAHSMGGLLTRETLRRFPALWDLVGQVVFLGTPHYGSPAIASYLKHHLWGDPAMRLLGRYIPPAVLRSMPGVLSLLPSPDGVYPGTGPSGGAAGDRHPCADFDLYDAAAYRLAGLDSGQAAALQRGLDAAAGVHRTLDRWHRSELTQSQRDRMTVIAGVGVRTLFQVRQAERGGLQREVRARATAVRRGDPDRDGDGRVPIASARLPSIGETRFARCTHTGLLSDSEVVADLLHRLRGEPLALSDTPEGAYLHLAAGSPGVPALTSEPVPVAGPEGDDPGYWDGPWGAGAGTDADSPDARDAAVAWPDLLGARLL